MTNTDLKKILLCRHIWESRHHNGSPEVLDMTCRQCPLVARVKVEDYRMDEKLEVLEDGGVPLATATYQLKKEE